MRITQTYIVPQDKSFEPVVRSKYQMLSNYLSLALSSWIAGKKLDIGAFNRIVFEEGDQDDFSVVGNRALVVCISKEFDASFGNLQNAEQVHHYFVRKYLEGFERFDEHFKVSLLCELQSFIGSNFADGYAYARKLASRKIEDKTYAVFGQYAFDLFSLLVVVSSRAKGIIERKVIYTSPPDPFVVRFRVGKINFESDGIRVLTSNEQETAFFQLLLSESGSQSER